MLIRKISKNLFITINNNISSVEIMKRKIIILLGVLLVLAIFSGTTVANSQDHNHNTNGEDDGIILVNPLPAQFGYPYQICLAQSTKQAKTF